MNLVRESAIVHNEMVVSPTHPISNVQDLKLKNTFKYRKFNFIIKFYIKVYQISLYYPSLCP
jgi:hypothetical protein